MDISVKPKIWGPEYSCWMSGIYVNPQLKVYWEAVVPHHKNL